MNNIWEVMIQRQDQLLQALTQHILISFVALLCALIIAIPLGIYIARHLKISEGILGIAAVLQTIPSLALLGLLIPLLGIGIVPAIVAIVIYALLPILRNTYTGIRKVDPSLLEAADAMGMTPTKRLFKVELPLAMPVIMAGIRTAMVLIIGTTTLAALIGAGGLGDIILLGIDRNDTALLILGAVPAALLAIIFDVLLRVIEKRSFRQSIIWLSATALIVIAVSVIPLLNNTQKDLVIAGKLGAEPEILINMYKELIEQDTNLTVELKPGMGKTPFLFNALKNKNIDIYPEFTGTALAEFLKEDAVSTDSNQVYNQAKEGMAKKFNMDMLSPMEYNNTYTLAVPEAYAQQNNLENISDLQNVSSQVKVGFTREFADRNDGYVGMTKLYGFTFPNLQTMEPKLRYSAIASGDIQLMDAYSTDSELQRYKLKVLKDDKGLFPPYQGAPLMRDETLKQYPEVAEALDHLSGQITDDEMRKMNYQVDVEGKPASEVAKTFLQQKGLLK
ncbi:ABC transporter permease/substrate-binding protein [Paenibacillus sp. PsM32]|uniref:Probable ergothioneine transporter EgtUBC n=1 Tax=Paenibacillus kyungheensis TaxID=1452732 RepID=A0AAX3M7Q8_9BACL|nr:MULTISPECIES: ABC transporter permease/substrate-binding protein [Paenibacillus]MDN4620080.1 ABC transporter permease/substrate-binding protein [Paenibacillus sp. PsM32]MDQ1234053.1 osmoprotectant transport system permease protein [Paenibacillus sp. SORGH_AS_0306]MDR6111098.1 osmoprotectant transport system permease protein [Paenibacillus sp. SORGH_AS_0338]WCT57946.1 ABC transporter permease/substrate-binding protein [Paenibacillus kyungheensis]WDF48947.1 ABC transporter permease/substrate-